MARNAVKVTDYYIRYIYDDEESYIVFFDTKEEMFYEAAKFYAFDDLDTGMDIQIISCKGEFCEYCGYEPGMRIRFKVCGLGGEVVWDQYYHEWDH